MRAVAAVFVLCFLLIAMNGQSKQNEIKDALLTRPERTSYAETSRYSDVMRFIAELQRVSPVAQVETFAVTTEGRNLPLVILARPAVRTPIEAARSGKPIVFVMANIHAGEVEGKEAAQQLMRDIAIGPLGVLLDKIVLLVAPIYNADGNEKIDINHRTEQNGPEGGVGLRENARGLDLNRDFIKLESPEARGLVGNVFNRWDPQVIIDLHTTDGSYHGYALTYSPPLNPNTDSRLTALLRDRLLPEVTRALRDRHGYRTYFYGNFATEANPASELPPDRSADRKAWATFDHRPRFGNNYVGLRNRLAILSEAYSYLDFRARVDVTDKFVRAVLRYVYDHPSEIVNTVRQCDAETAAASLTAGNQEGFGVSFELKPSDRPVEILVGSVSKSIDPRTGKPRLQATGEPRPVRMIEYGEFTATRRVKPPSMYILRPAEKRIADILLGHGISVEVLTEEAHLEVDRYVVKDVAHAQRSFQGHKETRLTVTAESSKETFEAGSFLVSTHQPKAALIFYLLEPESDDGLANWNFFDDRLEQADSPVYPVYRLEQQVRLPRETLTR